MELETRFIIATISLHNRGRIRFALKRKIGPPRSFTRQKRFSPFWAICLPRFFSQQHDYSAAIAISNDVRKEKRNLTKRKCKSILEWLTGTMALAGINEFDETSSQVFRFMFKRFRVYLLAFVHIHEWTIIKQNWKLDSLRVCVCVRRLNLIELSFSDILVYVVKKSHSRGTR